MHKFTHKSTYLQYNCERMAYPDGNMTHSFKDQSILVMDSEPEGNLKQEKKKNQYLTIVMILLIRYSSLRFSFSLSISHMRVFQDQAGENLKPPCGTLSFMPYSLQD